MRPLVLGIAGGSGSGKSTVARRLVEGLRDVAVAFVEMDAYYRNLTHLSAEERRRVNWDHPEAFDLELFVTQLDALRAGCAVERPVYDFATHARRTETVAVPPAEVLLLDGILLFADARVRAMCDLKVFLDTEADVRLVRRIRRDLLERGRPLDEILEQYLDSVRPMHLEFVEPTKRYADLIVLGGGENDVAIGMILATVRDRLRASDA